MTVIATDGKSMAGDTLLIGADERLGHMEKVFLRNGSVFGMCGSSVDMMTFRDNIGAPGFGFSKNFGALILTDSGVYKLERDGWQIKWDAPATLGAGGPIALGAMLAGATPAEAVQYAIDRHIKCGGEVTSIPLTTNISCDRPYSPASV